MIGNEPPHQLTHRDHPHRIISEGLAPLLACVRVLNRPRCRVLGAQVPVFRRIGIITVVT